MSAPLGAADWALALLTMAAYAIGLAAYRGSGRHPLLHPVPVSLALVIGTLLAVGVDCGRYQQANLLLSQWMGPATVALAVPLHAALRRLGRAALWPVLLAVAVAALGAVVSSFGAAGLAGLDAADAWAMATKSASLPFALAVAPLTGAPLDWVVLAVFCTGIPAAAAGPWMLARFGVSDPRVLGLSLGVTGHAFGVARATEWGPQATGFATLGMVLTGCLLSVAVPLAHALL